ncbi:MAG: hypothetical protein JO023_26315, partial [Chloroflexi bacterium]|nr:hypothetical protein [Chloroflexota bacterium]
MSTAPVQVPPFIADWELVTSYAEAVEVLGSPDFKAGRLETESLPFRGDVLIELDGHEHRPRRQLEGRLFSRAAIRHYETNVLDATIGRVLAESAAQREADGVVHVNLVDLANTLFLRIAATIIGLDDVETRARTALLNQYFSVLDNAIVVKWSERDHAEVVREGLVAKAAFIRDFVAPSVERRRPLVAAYHAGSLEREQLPMDLLSLMLLHPQPDWDDDLLPREAILYLSASIGSSSSAL